MKRIALTLLATLFAVLTMSTAPAAAEQVDDVHAQVTCYGDYCSGQDPETTGCSAGAYTVTSVGYNGGTLEVRWSPTCKTNWARINVGWSGYFRIQQTTGYQQHYSGTNGTYWWTSMIYSPTLGCRANAGNTYTAYV
jgi:uncharacterized protein DUF2690